jgi:Alg9-like mannosyltransferase family
VKEIYNKLVNTFNKNSLFSILLIGIFLRLLSAFFSKGYGMHDDHFVIIEVAQGWIDGLNIGGNIPVPGTIDKSFGSLFYTGIHYYLFKLLHYFNINDPQCKMLVVRIIHAFYSLLTIYFGFKITKKLSNVETAKKVGIVLAILWIMPILSVRNLVETFCIPMLLGGSYFLIKGNESETRFSSYLLAGILWGLAFSTRFQTIFFTGGVGLVLLFQKKWKETLFISLGMFIPVLIINGIVEGPVIGGVYFSKVINYVQYNIINKNNFNPQPWYNYFLLILGIVLPPASLILVPAIFNNWKKYIILLFPLVLFFLFHSYFPNKQERFILPVVPYFIILGFIGLDNWNLKEKYKKSIANIFKISFFINLILLFATVTMYSKRSRVESMYAIYNRGKLNEIIVENLEHKDGFQLPFFYCGQWPHITYFTKNDDSTFVKNRLTELSSINFPEYIFFVNAKNLDERIKNMKAFFPSLQFENIIEPSFMDIVFHKLNPVNKNEEIFIYKILKRNGVK